MQTLTVAPRKSVSDGTATYGPGASITVADSDAPFLITEGYALIPGTIYAYPGPGNEGSMRNDGVLIG